MFSRTNAPSAFSVSAGMQRRVANTRTRQIVLVSAPLSLSSVPTDTSDDMAFNQPPSRLIIVHAKKPPFVHEHSGVFPDLEVEEDVEPFDDDDAVGGEDRERVVRWIFHGVVECRGSDTLRIRREG